jgi:UDPglucose 6-dehydrogenase
MKKDTVGVVGLGYVGGAIVNAYKNAFNSHVQDIELYTYDIDETKNPTCSSMAELVRFAEMIYVAVPTPMTKTGECDTSIVEKVLDAMAQYPLTRIFIIKSTVPPGTTERIQKKYPNHHIFFSPEFLTEANYLNDYLNQELLVLGTSETIPSVISTAVLQRQELALKSVKNRMIVSATTAEMFKYVANLFLATKVSFANEMFDIANVLGANWEDLQNMILSDSRLGKTHWKVPGPDGHRGFGGSCFSKDICALITTSKISNVPTPLLEAVWNRNVEIDRPERDWEQLKGRAVTE